MSASDCEFLRVMAANFSHAPFSFGGDMNRFSHLPQSPSRKPFSGLSIAQGLATAVRETLNHDRFNLNPSLVFMLTNYSVEDVLHLDVFMTMRLPNINSSGKGTQDNAASYNSNIEAVLQRIIK